MLGLTFYPPLAADVHLHVLPYQDVARLKFTVSFESTDVFDQFRHDGVRVELWADVRQDGQWVGVPFYDSKSQGSLAFSFSDRNMGSHLQLHAVVSVPLFSQNRTTFLIHIGWFMPQDRR
jgi:hypothetical protein